jgi:alpha-mannosidase
VLDSPRWSHPSDRFQFIKQFPSDSGDLSGGAKRNFSNPLPARTILALLVTAVLLSLLSVRVEEKTALLWQIGKPDYEDREFALAPKDYGRYKEDGLFVVGQSDSRTDWPYVHPGPGDDFAGKQSHTFTIWFGVKDPKSAGWCKLKFRLLDRVRVNPPRLRVEINGRGYETILPPGAGDQSINGRPEQGHPYQFEIPFETSRLQAGDNVIRITTVSGSWLLYDWIGLEAPPEIQSIPVANRTWIKAVQPLPVLQERNGRSWQRIRLEVRHFGNPLETVIRVEGNEPRAARFRKVSETMEVPVAAVKRETKLQVGIESAGRLLDTAGVILKPVRPLTIFLLPHSHTDIGYTALQTEIEARQVDNLRLGIETARKTAQYPLGARFIWNVEVLWAVDLYLRRMAPPQRAAFREAVRKGQVALNGMYLNELTGLCRPEELLRLFRFSTQLASRCGVRIDSAMTSDIPGQTWGTVTAMAQAGIKYFSTAPNYFDRIGNILEQWENKPFYWVSPSGKEEVLVWIPYKGYALSHLEEKMTPKFVEAYVSHLEKTGYPYDLAYLRWSGPGDNAPPDASICDFVKDWNARNTWPRFVIASTREAFRTFERRYGPQLSRVGGDWTPYWEDGAGSSALETAMNRNSSDRLTQAEALWALFYPRGYPAASFEEAWRQVLLYSEHSWGAMGSVTDPEAPMTREQWRIKRSYALEADRQSRDLLARALESRGAKKRSPGSNRPHLSEDPGKAGQKVDVFNTTSWPRTELVFVSREISAFGDRVTDDRGRPVPSQRLKNGELAFLAREVPSLGGRRYLLSTGPPFREGKVTAEGTVLDNGILRLRVDKRTGGIVDLSAPFTEGNLVDTASSQALNDYLYLRGNNLSDLKSNGPVKITVKEPGPLLASLLIESDAPGCTKLIRELRLSAGSDVLELINTVDKKRLEVKNYLEPRGKESVNFAFPFNIPQGQMRLDLPLAVMRPEIDQLPGSCKNWLTVGRWVDVANSRFGITWVTRDAPLIQVGGLTATLLNSQTNPQVWRKKIEPTQKLYAWVMNNHWGTNYRAYQEGPVTFRFLLRPHGPSSPAEASRLAIGFSQPLLVTPSRSAAPPGPGPLLRTSSNEVLVLALKPSDDGRALMVRLFGAAGRTVRTTLVWSRPEPERLWLSDTSEKPGRRLAGPIEVPAYGVVTLRAEWRP